MNLLVLLAADYANVTRDGKLNVMGIFNTIFAENFPARHPQMHLIMKLSASPAEHGLKHAIMVRLLDEDAREELVNWSQEVAIPSSAGGRSAELTPILVLRDIVFPKEGEYQFSVLINNDEKGVLPLRVVRQKRE